MSKKQKPKEILRDHRGDYRLEVFFVNGKQKKRKVRLIDGLPVDEFMERNADDVYLVQEGLYEILHQRELERAAESGSRG